MTKYKYLVKISEVDPLIIEAELGPQAEDIAYAMLKAGKIELMATALPFFDNKVGGAIEIKPEDLG